MERITPKKSLGQNFLVDRNIARKIVRDFAPLPGELIVEIGPGEGALTEFLAETEARLIAIELDERSVIGLRERFGDRVEVIHDDILKVDFNRLAAGRGVERIRVLGNIPYYITSAILFHLIDSRSIIVDAMLMMQKEVALRLTAATRTKAYGILAVMLQTYAEVRRVFDIGPQAFRPPPKVTSSIVRLTYRDLAGIAGFEGPHRAIVHAAFNQRRKTLRNSLRGLISTESERERIFCHASIRETARAEELSPEDFIRLARLFASANAGNRG